MFIEERNIGPSGFVGPHTVTLSALPHFNFHVFKKSNIIEIKTSTSIMSLVFCSVLPQEQAIAMTTMFVTILVPSGWVLANLENYKKKQ